MSPLSRLRCIGRAEDAEIISAVKSGERAAFETLVRKYERKVFAIAWSRLGDADLAEDAAQETFFKAFSNLNALRHPERFAAWIGRIASNVAATLLRSRRRDLDTQRRWVLESECAADGETGDANEIKSQTTSESLALAIAERSPNLREALTLFYTEDKSVKETAKILGVSESVVKTRLHRARLSLRAQMEKQLEKSLTILGPKKDFSAGVMAMVPITIGTGTLGGSAALAGSALGGVAVAISRLITLFMPKKDRFQRMDLYLLLRQVTGGAASMEPADKRDLKLDQDDLMGFLRFLGKQLLVRDYRLGSAGMEIYLPEIRTNLLRIFLGGRSGQSNIQIAPSGEVVAFLDADDWKALGSPRKAELLDKAEVCKDVERAIRRSLISFVDGDLEKAKSKLLA